MPTINLSLLYRAASFADSSEDGNARLDMFVIFKTKTFKVATLTLAELRLLTGDSQPYRDIEAQLRQPQAGDRDYPMITDNSIDNETFVQWAQRFPDSVLTPQLIGLFPPRP